MDAQSCVCLFELMKKGRDGSEMCRIERVRVGVRVRVRRPGQHNSAPG